MNDNDDNLLIHMGGLGDVCLSESAFLTITRHFGTSFRAVGSKRVLDRFGAYFSRVDSMDGRQWAYLFSDSLRGRKWERIVFFGKDREGGVRARLRQLSGQLLFVDLHPDGESIPVEQHQLAQLAACGMEPVVVALSEKRTDRVILYPEAGFQKQKWPVSRFAEVFEELRKLGSNVIFMTPPGLVTPVVPTVSFEDLDDIEIFFSEGGIFFSNDSGMAHFAARCGLRPITIFRDTDATVWAPKGSRVLRCRDAGPGVREVIDLILSETQA
jgi:ADP-heptose:LPS heptosyltransferase